MNRVLWYTNASTKLNKTAIKRIDHLETIVEKQSKIIETLQITTEKQTNRIEKQNQVLLEIQQDLRNQKDLLEQTTHDEVNKLLNTNSSQYSLNRSIRQVSEHTAFTAYMDLGLKHLHNGETVVFNRVLYNEGNAYDTADGIFTCKISGVYLFSFFMDTFNHANAVLKIVIDGFNQVDAITETRHDYIDVQGGNLMITFVKTGQSVWVVQYYEDDGVVRGEQDFRFSTFSGVILY